MASEFLIQTDLGYDSKTFNPNITEAPIIVELTKVVYPDPPAPPEYIEYNGYLDFVDLLSLNIINRSNPILFEGTITVSATNIKVINVGLSVYKKDTYEYEYFSLQAMSGLNSTNTLTWNLSYMFEKQPLLKITEDIVNYSVSIGFSLEAPDFVTTPTLTLDQYNFEAVETRKL